MDVTYYLTSYLHSVVLSSDRHTLLEDSRFPIVERMNSGADRGLPVYILWYSDQLFGQCDV